MVDEEFQLHFFTNGDATSTEGGPFSYTWDGSYGEISGGGSSLEMIYDEDGFFVEFNDGTYHEFTYIGEADLNLLVESGYYDDDDDNGGWGLAGTYDNDDEEMSICFNSDGTLVVGWQDRSGYRYYFDGLNGLRRDGWFTLNGNTITRADGDNGQSGVWAFRVNNGTLILNDATGTGTLDGGEGLEHSMLWANGANAKIIINSGNYTVGGNPTGNNYNVCVYASNGGQVEIYGGTFENEEPQTGSANLYPALNVSNGSPGTITVYGGTFKNYDPATGDDANGDTFVATGYSSVKVSDDPTPNGTYQVVRGTGAATSTDLAKAIKSGAELITLASDVTIDNSSVLSSTNHNSAIDLNGNTLTINEGVS